MSERTFLVGRLHGGTFLRKDAHPASGRRSLGEFDVFTIPLAEFFRLDGRENLKGLSERLRGTEQLHTTWEYFFPWFLDAHHDFLKLDWQNWYWILYAGSGDGGLRPGGLHRLRRVHPRRRGGLRVLLPAPAKYTLLPLRDRGTGFERRWRSGGAYLGQVVPLSAASASLDEMGVSRELRCSRQIAEASAGLCRFKAHRPEERRMRAVNAWCLVALVGLVPARRPSAGEEANAPTATGETGLFTLLSGETLPAGRLVVRPLLQQLGPPDRRPGRRGAATSSASTGTG